ncbi:hypothetical protein [Clostridium sp. 1001271B_151109_B4]|uniref:hypothetical protein n=1 Tax=Clostridium sp. 1001271B_151109_B4 TaxID=2787148 RepID=UPI00325FA4D4
MIILEKYDYVFRWLKKAKKPERHIEEMEIFAKKHPIIFMKFHKESSAIVKYDETDDKYIKAKEELTELFNKNEDAFKQVFHAVETKFNY